MKRPRRDVVPPLLPASRVNVRHALYGYSKGYGDRKGQFIWVGQPEVFSSGALAGEVQLLSPDDSSALVDFELLASGKFRDVFAFAARYGPLSLCERHQLPTHHGPVGGAVADPSCGSGVQLQDVDRYRFFARSVRALRQVANALRIFDAARSRTNWKSVVSNQRIGEDLQFLFAEFFPETYGFAVGIDNNSTEQRERRRLEPEADAADALWFGVTWWLAMGRLEPALRTPGSGERRWALQLAGYGLWGTIARQLAARIVEHDEVSLIRSCKGGCGRDAPLSASGRRGRPREYCDECDPVNLRQQRSRQKRRIVKAMRHSR